MLSTHNAHAKPGEHAVRVPGLKPPAPKHMLPHSPPAQLAAPQALLDSPFSEAEGVVWLE